MKYKEIKVFTDVEMLDPLAETLTDLGVTGLVINDPRDKEEFMAGRETWHWDYVEPSVLALMDGRPSITFYLGERQDETPYTNAVKAYDYSISIVDDQDWLHKWEEYFVPVKVSEMFVVKPTWRPYEKKADELVIDINPGQAFGTGTHATTYLCLRLLEKHLKAGDSVLDVGSGTGILSIASAMLGAGDILAVDLDPEAVRSTRENASLNGVSDRVTCKEGDLTKGLSYKGDVVVANLMAALVIMLTGDVAKHIKSGGIFISSGIILEKEAAVTAALESAGFTVVEVQRDDGWCAIAAELTCS